MSRAASARDGKIKLIAIILAAILVGGAAGGFVVKSTLAKKHEAKGEEDSEDNAEVAEDQGDSADSGDKAETKSEKAKTSKSTRKRSRTDRRVSRPGRGEIVNLGEFLVNVASKDRLRYVKCEIAIQVIGLEESGAKKKKGHGEGEEGPLTKEQLAWAKDAVIRVFADTPFESLMTSEGREKLRERLAVAIENALDGPAVRQVLFTSFVMQ